MYHKRQLNEPGELSYSAFTMRTSPHYNNGFVNYSSFFTGMILAFAIIVNAN